MAKPWAKQFYNSKAWRDLRRYILDRDRYTCADCYGRAEEVHHINPINENNINDINITLNPDNLMSLCKSCHSKRTDGHSGDIGERFIFDENGQVIQI